MRTLKLIGTIAFAVILAFSMSSCGDLAKGVTTIDVDPLLINPVEDGEKGSWVGAKLVINWNDLIPTDVKETHDFTGQKLSFTKNSIGGTGVVAKELGEWLDALVAKYDVEAGFKLDITVNNNEIKYTAAQRGDNDLYETEKGKFTTSSAPEEILKYEIADGVLTISSRYNKTPAAEEPTWSEGDDWQIYFYGKWTPTVYWEMPPAPAE